MVKSSSNYIQKLIHTVSTQTHIYKCASKEDKKVDYE